MFGHSHVASAATHDKVFFINPGSAGPRRFKLQRSVAILNLPPKVSTHLDFDITLSCKQWSPLFNQPYAHCNLCSGLRFRLGQLGLDVLNVLLLANGNRVASILIAQIKLMQLGSTSRWSGSPILTILCVNLEHGWHSNCAKRSQSIESIGSLSWLDFTQIAIKIPIKRGHSLVSQNSTQSGLWAQESLICYFAMFISLGQLQHIFRCFSSTQMGRSTQSTNFYSLSSGQ